MTSYDYTFGGFIPSTKDRQAGPGDSVAVVTETAAFGSGVTLNYHEGVITTNTATTAAVTATDFTVTNSTVTAGSRVFVNIVDYNATYGTAGIPYVNVDTIADGSFIIKIVNAHASNALNGALKIAFKVCNNGAK